MVYCLCNGLDERYFDSSWGAREFSPLQNFQTSSGTYPASYFMGTGGSFPGGIVAKA